MAAQQHDDHNHDHAHGHHHHAPTDNIAVAFFLNTIFAVIELIGGMLTNSVAILSDALHDFGDSLSLGTAWYFQKRSKKGRSEEYTYGYQRFSLVGAVINSVVLIIGSIFIIRESAERIFQPQQPNADGMIWLAVLGIAVNGVAMLRLKKGDSVNERVVSLHFLEDVLGWVAVLVGAIIMKFTDAAFIDPLLSLLIALFILFNVYRNISPAIKIFLQGVPGNISEAEVKSLILKEKEILDLHDFHLWTLDGINHVVSLHVVVSNNMDLKAAEILKEKVKERLKEIRIAHATVEVEFNPEHCGQLKD